MDEITLGGWVEIKCFWKLGVVLGNKLYLEIIKNGAADSRIFIR